MNKQSATRNCHWVPQAYLKSFSSDTKGRRIWRIGKKSITGEEKLIKKVAVRNWLYTPKDSEGYRDDGTEKEYSNLENALGSPDWSQCVMSSMNPFRMPNFKEYAATLVSNFLSRHPSSLEALNAVWKMAQRHIENCDHEVNSIDILGTVINLDAETKDELLSLDDESIKASWLNTGKTDLKIALDLLDKRWVVLTSEYGGFITSDRPVTTIHHSGMSLGFKNPDNKVIFPLSPFKVLLIDGTIGPTDIEVYSELFPGVINSIMHHRSYEHSFSPIKIDRSHLLADDPDLYDLIRMLP